ncbi:hypothetical protein AVEN_139095-1 [Araneus ventricosus]|uniref:HTH CENPB-type domain-containing protein n=1 Tax=Araneus ventricosus TaxID=182803 RepID=A0A4Y2T7B4_ARAVE|nr:hypothetical protein AVEN_139095-1 [Araneus ventricosus]
MAKRGHYGRWSELDLLMAVGTYKNGGAGLNECSRIYNVPKATIKRHADEQNSTTIEIKTRKRAHVQYGLSALVEDMRKKMKTKYCKKSALGSPGAQVNTIKSCEESALEIPGEQGNTIKSCEESALETPGGDVNKTKTCEQSALETPGRDVKPKSGEESALETPGGHVNNLKANMSKRGHYGRWSENDLLKAVAAYKNGKKGLNECSRIYNVPKATIKRHADGKNSVANEIKSLGRQPTFSPVMEKILSEYLLHLKESYFGLTIKEIRKLVFEIAEKHGLSHSFNKNKKMAGKKWFYSFLRRNPQLSLRKPESQSPSQLPECT